MISPTRFAFRASVFAFSSRDPQPLGVLDFVENEQPTGSALARLHPRPVPLLSDPRPLAQGGFIRGSIMRRAFQILHHLPGQRGFAHLAGTGQDLKKSPLLAQPAQQNGSCGSYNLLSYMSNFTYHEDYGKCSIFGEFGALSNPPLACPPRRECRGSVVEGETVSRLECRGEENSSFRPLLSAPCPLLFTRHSTLVPLVTAALLDAQRGFIILDQLSAYVHGRTVERTG